MMRTTYKTKEPQHLKDRNRAEDFADAEYRQVVIKAEASAAANGSFVLEVYHGWWDEATKGPINNRQLLRAEYESIAEAEAAYSLQVASLVRDGYIHTFVFDPQEPSGRRYEQIG
jgi:hypothetical protein